MSVANSSVTDETSSCCLDQHIVGKGSSTTACIFGGADGGVHFGILAADYLLCKLLSSQRYSQVVCVCLDRRADTVLATAERHFEQLQSAENRPDLQVAAMREKLRTVEGSISEPADLKNILKNILSAVTEQMTSDGARGDPSARSPNSGSNSNRSTAIIVYSLSELMLAVGTVRAMRFVGEVRASVSAALQPTCASSGDSKRGGDAGGEPVEVDLNSSRVSSKEVSAPSVSLLALVHSSLHTAHTLSRLLPQPQPSSPAPSSSSPFNASVIVKPNDGSLSAQIVCEMQVVRVSGVTGKVVEASNYFTDKPGQSLLVPIIKLKAKKEPIAATGTAAVTSANFSVTAESLEMSKLSVASSSSGGVHDNRRLITFDSTDPEFDEDSDPDADLDL